MKTHLTVCFLTLLVALSGCTAPAGDADTQPITSTPEEKPELHVVSAEKELTVALVHAHPLLPVIRADGVNNNCVYIQNIQTSNTTKVAATFTPGTGAPDLQENWVLKIDLGAADGWFTATTGTPPLHLEVNITDIPFEEEDDRLFAVATLMEEEPSAKVDAQGTLRIEVQTYNPEQIDIRTGNRTSCS